MNKVKWNIISLFLFVVAAVLILALSQIVLIGLQLARLHISVCIVFYAACAFLAWWFLIRPLAAILMTEETPGIAGIEHIIMNDAAAAKRVALRVLATSPDASPEHTSLAAKLRAGADIRPDLAAIIRRQNDEVLGIIKSRASAAFVSVALSQNGSLDGIMLLVHNMSMLKALVDSYCFRPSIRDLFRLYVQVLAASMVFKAVEDMNPEELVPLNIPGLPIIGSFVQGCGSVLFTVRTGLLAREYIRGGGSSFNAMAAKKRLAPEILSLTGQVLTEGAGTLSGNAIGTIISMFTSQPAPTPVASADTSR